VRPGLLGRQTAVCRAVGVCRMANPHHTHRAPTVDPPCTRRRVVHGLFAVILAATSFDRAVNGPHARGPWFGALAVLVYAGVFGWVILAPRGYDSWQRKHREFDAAFFGPLLFLVLGYVTSLPLLWCAAITLVATPLVVLLGRRRRTTAD